jgi:hypothetical protein
MADDSRTDTADGGFLSRWSRRKEVIRRGGAVPAEPVTQPLSDAPVARAATSTLAPSASTSTSTSADARSRAGEPAAVPRPVASQPTPGPAAPARPPPPTLEDAEALTYESDFRRFVGRDVDPAVKNTALRKLFADPHFNVMDGLDTYIEDYGRPDPIPASMLAKMAQSAFLGLVRDDDPPAAQTAAAASPALAAISDPTPEAGTPPPPTDPVTAEPLPEPLHEDPDLRLQPHDAARHGGHSPGPAGDAGHLG